MLIGLCLCSFYFTTRVNLANKAIENGTGMEENGFPFLGIYHAYEDATEKMPFNDEGFIRASTVLIARYNTDEDAVKKEETKLTLSDYLTKMEKIEDKNSELFYTMGIGYATLGNNEKADYYLNKALILLSVIVILCLWAWRNIILISEIMGRQNGLSSHLLLT